MFPRSRWQAFAGAIAAGLLGLGNQPALAACIGGGTGPLSELEQLSFRDPSRALGELATADASSHDGAALTADQRATVIAMMADAHRQLNHGATAFALAEEGIRLTVASPRSPVGIRLRIARAMMLDDSQSTAQALSELDSLIDDNALNARAVACAQKDRGWIRDSTGDTDGALRDLISAYEYLHRNGPEEEAMLTTGRLATVYRTAGDFDAAATLTKETIEYFSRIDAPVRVATGRNRLGRLYLAQGRPAAALVEFEEMKRLTLAANDATGVALADVRRCEANVDLKDYSAAREGCATAERELRELPTRAPMDEATLHTQYARISLAHGDTRSAIVQFSSALDTHAKDLNGELGATIYEGLAKAKAGTGDYAGAYNAVVELERRRSELGSTQSARERAALRVRFDMDREVEKNKVLMREREVLLERNSRIATQTRLVIAITFLTLMATFALVVLVQRRRQADVARRAAESRVEELGRLCAGVAHDFNNLMTVIQQAAGLLGRNIAATEGARASELLSAIRAAATTGGDITRQLLAFGRQESMAPRLVDCAEYFESQRTLFEQAGGRDGSVLIVIASPSPTAWIDPAQLTNALVNLVINAREALTRPGIITISVATSPEHPKCTCISVSDTGRGMSAQTRQRATEAFFSTKQPGQGSGLGLSAAHGFAIQSGGQMQIESVEGAGTTIRLLLPEDRAAFDGAQAAKTP